MGRKAGITKDEYLSLIKLEKKDFDYREWIALVYARESAFAKGGEVPAGINDQFNMEYSKTDQKLINKLIRTMIFANYCGNIYYKRPWKKDAPVTSCEVNFQSYKTNPEK